MKQFWQEVLLLPYKSNSQDNPLHEKQVEELLIKYGFNYVAQPNGIQASPDFRVTLENGKTVDIECKSSKQTYPTYNGGLPKEGVVYIFSSKRYDETTIFFADDVVSAKKRQQFANLVEELNSVLKSIKWMKNGRKIRVDLISTFATCMFKMVLVRKTTSSTKNVNNVNLMS